MNAVPAIALGGETGTMGMLTLECFRRFVDVETRLRSAWDEPASPGTIATSIPASPFLVWVDSCFCPAALTEVGLGGAPNGSKRKPISKISEGFYKRKLLEFGD
jgi:hypothetical protein